MKRNNYRRMIFLPVLIILTEICVIGHSVLDRNSAAYEKVENGILYTAREIDTTEYDDPPQNADAEHGSETSDKTNKVTAEEAGSTEKININKANAEELMKLPGIGEKMSERIIETRESMGGYRVIEDIMNVDGIGEKKFEKIKELITVE